MTLRQSRMMFLGILILAACQHAAEAQAAEPATTPVSPSPPPSGESPTEAPKGLPDKVAREAAAKSLGALQACSLKPTGGVVTGQLTIVTQECTKLACMRTCCNTCKFSAVLSGNGPQRGLNAGQLRQLFPAFPDKPLECEINEWNKQLKPLTIGLSLPEEKGAESGRGPVSACLQAAER